MGYSVINKKTGKSLFLHMIIGRSKKALYFFSYDPLGNVDLPVGLEVITDSRSGHPYIRRIGGPKKQINFVKLNEKLIKINDKIDDLEFKKRKIDNRIYLLRKEVERALKKLNTKGVVHESAQGTDSGGQPVH